ncbi:MAG: NUDIX domain-containing protein [Caldilineaceae bacterium]
MAQIIHGERIGRTAALKIGCAAVIFDAVQQCILLTRREDNGRWCLPGGGLEPGEDVSEGCIREVWEETGLHVEITRLIGVYSSPHMVSQYGDGKRFQFVSFCFEATITGGELRLSNETTAFGYFSRAEMADMDVMENHVPRIADAYLCEVKSFIR